jgi:hypothetical protein
MPLYPPPSAPGGSSAGVWQQSGTAAPSGGVDGDFGLYSADGVGDGANGQFRADFYKKSAGAWLSTLNNAQYFLIARPAPYQHGPTAGWRWFPTMDTTAETGVRKLAVSATASQIHATTSGTVGGFCALSGAGTGVTGALAFVSAYCFINVLPEAGRFLWFGQVYTDSFNLRYGYGVEVNSSGAYRIVWIDDLYGGGVNTIVSGGTGLAAGDRIYYERFGRRITAARVAAAGNVVTSQIEGLIPAASDTTYAFVFGKAANGFATDASSVRVAEARWFG